MTWEEVCAHPSLQDLPFKLELNEYGQIVMSPASNQHSLYQARLTRLLMQYLEGGETLTECSIETSKGTKVADVVWASAVFLERHQVETPYSKAPEICAEIISPSNSYAEMDEKITLYLAKGAQEVWLCDLEGCVTFFSHEGQRPNSYLAPDFPSQL